MECGAAEATGLGFVCFVQSLCVVSQQNWFGVFFLLHKFSNFTPPPPQAHNIAKEATAVEVIATITENVGEVYRYVPLSKCWGGGVILDILAIFVVKQKIYYMHIHHQKNPNYRGGAPSPSQEYSHGDDILWYVLICDMRVGVVTPIFITISMLGRHAESCE